MAKAVVFFAEGTEECEALLVVDLPVSYTHLTLPTILLV